MKYDSVNDFPELTENGANRPTGFVLQEPLQLMPLVKGSRYLHLSPPCTEDKRGELRKVGVSQSDSLGE